MRCLKKLSDSQESIAGETETMCRSIKTLRPPYSEPTDEEVSAAALQYIRKISGFRTPSKLNRPAFDRAVRDVTQASARLLDSLCVRTPGAASQRPNPDR